MGNRGNSVWRIIRHALAWLVVQWVFPAAASDLQLARLPVAASETAVLAGLHDAELVATSTPVIFSLQRDLHWWRVTAQRDFPADQSPQLVLANPFLTRVSAWRPHQDMPTRHALFGDDQDRRYSTRALVIDLPEGLHAGQSVWLAVQAPASSPMQVSIEPLSSVHADDLAFVAWRSAVMATLFALSLLGIAFWIGAGQRSYAYFSSMLMVACLYLAGMGGEIRYLDPVASLFADSARLQRLLCCAGVLLFLLFQRLYLDLPRHLPRLDRFVRLLAILMACAGLFCQGMDHPLLAQAINLLIVASCSTVLIASARLALDGHGGARTLILSWLPMSVFVAVRSVELAGAGQILPWTSRALDTGFAIAALGLSLGITRDVLRLRRARDHASALASQDVLTGALSRMAIERGLQEVQQHAGIQPTTPFVVAFIDLDYFKSINDSHGHDVGDQFLQLVVQRVRSHLRKGDLLGRYGGDEFLLVMPGTTLDTAHGIAQRICDAVASGPVAISGLQINASLSIGLARFHPGESVRQLLRRADAALYASKAAGRGRVNSHLPTPPAAVAAAITPMQ